MMRGLRFLRDRRGSAGAEMALVAPLLCAILIGSVELGSFFYNEHILQKAVRDAARYAARQGFTNYGCSGEPIAPVGANTRALVRTSLLSGGSDRFADIQDADITISTSCKTSQGGQSMTNGIYKGMATGAPIVTVTAAVDYSPVIGAAFGFSGVGYKLNASQQAAVTGI
jgi:Flp pilus assembly protein TadG